MKELENPIEYVNIKKVSCDGGNDDLGHPKIYLDMGIKNEIMCPYCSKVYIYTSNNK